MNIKVLGIAVAVLMSAQTFAASPQLQQLSRNQVGSSIMRELGVSVTTADLTAALTAKYGAQQAAVILAAINQFNTAVAGGTNADTAIRSIFKVSPQGQFTVANLVGSSRTGMVAQSCSKDQFATELAADTKVSYANFKAVVDAGLISMGVCGQGVTKYVPNARENLGEGEVCTLNAGGANMNAAQRDEVRLDCYAGAFNNDPGATQVTAASLKPTISALRNECQIIR